MPFFNFYTNIVVNIEYYKSKLHTKYFILVFHLYFQSNYYETKDLGGKYEPQKNLHVINMSVAKILKLFKVKWQKKCIIAIMYSRERTLTRDPTIH